MESIKDRTYKFSLEIIKIVNTLPRTVAGIELGKQLIRSGTSIGANIEEAGGGYTKSDFTYHLNIAKKEAKETAYWLKLIYDSGMISKEKDGRILIEIDEIIKILTKSVLTAEKRLK